MTLGRGFGRGCGCGWVVAAGMGLEGGGGGRGGYCVVEMMEMVASDGGDAAAEAVVPYRSCRFVVWARTYQCTKGTDLSLRSGDTAINSALVRTHSSSLPFPLYYSLLS